MLLTSIQLYSFASLWSVSIEYSVDIMLNQRYLVGSVQCCAMCSVMWCYSGVLKTSLVIRVS